MENNLNILLKEDNNVLDNNIENIDITMNFLKDLSNNTTNFVVFLQLIQTHMDIELLFESLDNGGNSHLKRKIMTTISNDKMIKLNNLVNIYFNTLSLVYLKNDNIPVQNPLSKLPIDNFFLYQSLNIIFHKCIKIQICLFCSIMITLSQLGTYEISIMIKNHFHQITKEILNPLLNIFDTFIKEEINLNYPELLTINLSPDFNNHFNKLHKIQKFTNNLKNSELITLISKNLDKCVNSMKYYSTLNLKYSTIKPFGDALNQLLFSIDRKSLYQFATIALNTLLFGELESNKNRSLQNCLASNLKLIKNINNGLIGSSITNNIKDFPPFLPQINPKYKYTLVLDMDETLIHYFFTHINGMFFVRPFCFDFLRELNEIYEIVTFTAGTKEYADNILNILDIDNNIIKYRLYRQHTTILGCSIYKDLSKLGRDLSRVIIIDNLKENFKMQPNNGIFIKTWTNDINDVQFKDILKILKDIVAYNVIDVRPIIQKMNEDIKISRNIIRPYLNINISKYVG
jgi:Dullard-like phosphatase family protein